ncbi:MAG TPA: rhamnulokinase family protein [Clostridia bacterium]|nr:rhamnulokinase family protein [Clostridia bacterium]
MEYFLSIDIGASSGRHILGFIENGKLILEEVYRFSNSPDRKDSRLSWDISRLLNEIKNGIKKCVSINKIPVSMGIDTWGVDYVLLDKDNKEILPVYCYRDDRTKDFFKTPITNEELYSITGTQFQPFNTIYQLLSDKASNRLDEAENMLYLPEYFSYKLTGKMAHEYTIASTSGLVNANNKQYDEDILSRLGIKKDLLGRLEQPGYCLGNFSEEIKQELGCDIKVILPATHDTASAVIASPGNEIYISSGTWSLLGIETEPILSLEAKDSHYSNEGSILGKVRFLKNIMGLWMIQEVRHELNDAYEFHELAALAEKENHYDYAINVNSPEFLNPNSMIDAIKNRCQLDGAPIPNTVGEIAHCVYNSLAHCYETAVNELERITKTKYNVINIIGGGSKNDYLNRLTAKYLNRTVYAGPCEATAIGNLLVQIVTFGSLKDYTEAKKLVRKSFNVKNY